jgi:hypothetical protein
MRKYPTFFTDTFGGVLQFPGGYEKQNNEIGVILRFQNVVSPHDTISLKTVIYWQQRQ